MEKNWGIWSLSILLIMGLRIRNVKKERTKGIETSFDTFKTAITKMETITPRKICAYLLEVVVVSVMKQL
jgi:hypothetical protein